MEERIVQLDGGSWPSGDSRALAMLTFEPEDVANRLPVTFSRERDDLGEYWGSAFRTDSGRLFLLVRYLEAPMSGVTAYVDSNDDQGDALRQLLQLLGIDRQDLQWVPEDVDPEAG